MDADIQRRSTRTIAPPNRYGFDTTDRGFQNQIILLPDADLSENENFSSDSEDEEHNSAGVVDNSSSDEDEDDEIDNNSNTDGFTYRFRSNLRMLVSNLQFEQSDMPDLSEYETPVHFFKLFFSEDMIDMISKETNNYGLQNNVIVATDSSEIEQLLGVFIRMGIFKVPSFRMYWMNKCRLSVIADVISRDRFEKLKRFLHFVDNNTVVTDRNDPHYDRFIKIRPLLNILLRNCRQIPSPQKCDVDEQIIPFKGRHGLKVFIRNKPHPWGFKAYSRNSTDGFTHDFIFHDGEKPTPQHSCGYVPGDIVIKLCETLPAFRNHIVAFDNYFNSLELQVTLKEKYGIHSVGTLRANRMRTCKLKSLQELKAEGRGSFDSKVDANSGIVVVRWFDSNVVQVSSTYCGVEPIDQVRRYDKKEKREIHIPRPQLVQEYNSIMGGTDTFDMLMSFYRIQHKSKKWYMRIFFWILHTAIVNGWILYRKHVDSRVKLLDFTVDVAYSLIHQGEDQFEQNKL